MYDILDIGANFSRGAMMLTASYSIEELADESGFDKRAIRSFIEQGLLNGPDSKGRYARYTTAHLVRLKAIKQLRDTRHMSLAEIRAAFMSMTEEDIHALSTRPVVQPKSTDLKSSVLDYLRLARSPQSDAADTFDGREVVFLPPLTPRLSALDRLLKALQVDGARRSPALGKTQVMHRFSVTPDIEITVRNLQDGGQVEQWERIAECMREILLGGTQSE